MPSYNTRRLTARDTELLDKLEADPRYRKLAQQLRGAPATVAKPQGKAVQPLEPPAAPTTPAEPATAATGHDTGIVGPSVPKPRPAGHKHQSDR